MSSDGETINRGPTNVEKLRGLPWGVAWSLTNSVFAQYTFFGSVFVLFLNQLGLDKSQIGSLLSLLPFLGIIAIFIAAPVARLGHKRVFIVSMAARTAIAAFLMLTPMVLAQFGQGAVLTFVVVAVGAFSLFRSTGFTAFYPWNQEHVPDDIRGKFTAIKSALASLAGLLAMLVAGYVLGPDPTLSRFLILIAAGVAFGVTSVWAATRIPGGAPIPRTDSVHASSWRDMLSGIRDPNLMRYLFGAGLITLATGPLISFVPLFMKEQVGLSSDHIVWLEMGVLVGGLASSYLWGWLADRYGSKPVMVAGVYLLPLVPLAWLLMPRQIGWSLYIALAIAVAQGLIITGWRLGSGRLLFVRVVPVESRTAYMALYYAWMGITGGLSQLLGGWLVDRTADVSGQWWILSFDPYTVLFLIGIISPLLSIVLFQRVAADSAVTPRQFAGMFLRGNPLLALGSLIRYHRARDEQSAVAMTERLGSTHSPLTDEELIEALHDPRFFVRFEAIVSIARRGPDQQLTDALIETLEGNEPSLSTVAAWGLGRMGDERAITALRRGLQARYHSVQAHCIRSLGSLGDTAILPELLDRLATEQDVGLQMAIASAVGKLGATEAVGPLLALLNTAATKDARSEFALALARLVGDEHEYIQLQHRTSSQPGTTLSRAVTALKGRWPKSMPLPQAAAKLDQAAEALAQEDLPRGVALLHDALGHLPADLLTAPCGLVVRECMHQMEHLGPRRIEYVLLALHVAGCLIGE